MPRRSLTDALSLIYREATRSPWICLNALRDPEERADDGGDGAAAQPVLVLGGFLSHPYYYAPLGRILRRRGYEVHFDEVLNAQPFKAHVTSLGERVRRIVDDTGVPVRVVGHSLGGLQAMALMLESPEAVGQVVAVASPIGGGTPWRPLQRLAERVLRVRSRDTGVLRNRVAPYACRITTISSPQDLVAPPAVCAIAGATNIVLSTVTRPDEALASHVGVIFMQSAIRTMLHVLARPCVLAAPVRCAV